MRNYHRDSTAAVGTKTTNYGRPIYGIRLLHAELATRAPECRLVKHIRRVARAFKHQTEISIKSVLPATPNIQWVVRYNSFVLSVKNASRNPTRHTGARGSLIALK